MMINVWKTNSPLNRIYLLSSDDTKNWHERSANRNIRPAWLRLKLQIHFPTLKQPKRHIKMVVLMLPLPTKAATEETMNICTDQRLPTCHSRPQIISGNLDSHNKTHHNQHSWQRCREILNGKWTLCHWHLLQSPQTLNMNCCHDMTNQF